MQDTKICTKIDDTGRSRVIMFSLAKKSTDLEQPQMLLHVNQYLAGCALGSFAIGSNT